MAPWGSRSKSGGTGGQQGGGGPERWGGKACLGPATPIAPTKPGAPEGGTLAETATEADGRDTGSHQSRNQIHMLGSGRRWQSGPRRHASSLSAGLATVPPVAPSCRSTSISEIRRSPEGTGWEVEDSSWRAVWGAGESDTGAADSARGGATGTWEICLACVVSSCSRSDSAARSNEILCSAACAGVPPCSAKSCRYCSDVRGTSSCKITRQCSRQAIEVGWGRMWYSDTGVCPCRVRKALNKSKPGHLTSGLSRAKSLSWVTSWYTSNKLVNPRKAAADNTKDSIFWN